MPESVVIPVAAEGVNRTLKYCKKRFKRWDRDQAA